MECKSSVQTHTHTFLCKILSTAVSLAADEGCKCSVETFSPVMRIVVALCLLYLDEACGDTKCLRH